jgi:hypothetical protein
MDFSIMKQLLCLLECSRRECRIYLCRICHRYNATLEKLLTGTKPCQIDTNRKMPERQDYFDAWGDSELQCVRGLHDWQGGVGGPKPSRTVSDVSRRLSGRSWCYRNGLDALVSISSLASMLGYYGCSLASFKRLA